MLINKRLRLLLCIPIAVMAISQMASGQENDDRAKPTPSGKVSRQKPVKADADKKEPAKGARKNYADTRVKESYKSLTSLDESTQTVPRTFTLGGNVQDPAPSIDGFKQRKAEAIARRIQFDDDLITKGKAKASVYADRAYQKAAQGKLVEAVADYDRAIEMDPGVAEFWRNRGHFKLRLGDLDGAMADCERALALAPADALAYFLHGRIKGNKSDYEGALSDINRVVELAPAMPDGYMMRGHIHLLLNHWEEAESDFRRYCQLAEARQDYPRVFIWITQMRLGKKEAANTELSDYLTKKETFSTVPTWTDKVGKFLLGNISEAEFFAAVSTKPDAEGGQHCEAWYYAGLKKLLSGDKIAAIEDFRQCVATKQFTFAEYDFATAELKILAP